MLWAARATLAMSVLAAGLVLTAPAGAACGTTKTAQPFRSPASGPPALVVGDSITVSAIPPLRASGWQVNGRECRAMPEGLAVLREHAAARSLPHLVAIALGTNGTLSRAELGQALSLLGPSRLLVLVTPRELGGRSGPDAELVRGFTAAHPDQTYLLDWAGASAGRRSWFARDGIHLTGEGIQAFASLLEEVLPYSVAAPDAESGEPSPAPEAPPEVTPKAEPESESPLDPASAPKAQKKERPARRAKPRSRPRAERDDTLLLYALAFLGVNRVVGPRAAALHPALATLLLVSIRSAAVSGAAPGRP